LKTRGVTQSVLAQLEEPTIGDLVLATVAANERAIAATLNGLLRESNRYASVLDATAEAVTRKQLVRLSGIDNTNLSKVTSPLVRAGWLHSVASPTGVVLRRSLVIDVLLGGKTVKKWQQDVRRRLGTTA
jgi:hypothetical protein